MLIKKVLKNNSGLSQTVSFAGCSIIGFLFLMAIIQGALLFSSVIKINNVAELVSNQIQMSGMVDTKTMNLLNSSLKNSRIKEYKATVTIEKSTGNEQAVVTATSAPDKKVQLQTQCNLAMWASCTGIILVFLALFLIELRKEFLKDKEDLFKRIQIFLC